MLFLNGQEYLDHFRIELAAGAALDFHPRVRQRKRAAIRTVANHGIERIGDGKNARPQRNLIASQSTWIARTVVELLVRQYNFRGIAKERDADEHVVADFAVRAHDFLFVVIERTRLAEDAIGNGHLSDIVEKR